MKIHRFFQHILTVISSMAMISCISDEFSDQGQNDDMIDIQFAVSDFPGYGNTRAIGIQDEVIHIDFSDASRNYSRLRIAVVPEAELSVTIGSATSALSFIPAGTDESVENGETYTLDTDDKGNAYLYGTFAADATINVRCNGILLTDFRFRADRFANGTVPGKSYALNAIPPYPLSAQHYISLKDAFDDINNATSGANATLRNWITVPLTSNGQPI